ncbi:unnamed protein product, partial [Rhizoctonia solani]
MDKDHAGRTGNNVNCSLRGGPFGALESAFESPRPWLLNGLLRDANGPAVAEQTTTSVRGEFIESSHSLCIYY